MQYLHRVVNFASAPDHQVKIRDGAVDMLDRVEEGEDDEELKETEQRAIEFRRIQVQQRERSVKIKLKIKKTYFENKNNTILKIKDLAAKIECF